MVDHMSGNANALLECKVEIMMKLSGFASTQDAT